MTGGIDEGSPQPDSSTARLYMRKRTHVRMHEYSTDQVLDKPKEHGYMYYSLRIHLTATLLIANYGKLAIRNQTPMYVI